MAFPVSISGVFMTRAWRGSDFACAKTRHGKQMRSHTYYLPSSLPLLRANIISMDINQTKPGH